MKALLLILALAAIVSAQETLPDYGEITDLKGMSRVYVATDSTDSRKWILDELKKHPALKVEGSAEDADFILECKETGKVVTSSTLIPEVPTFEMRAYTVKDGRRRIAWSRTKTSLRPAPKLLTGDFLKAFKKIK